MRAHCNRLSGLPVELSGCEGLRVLWLQHNLLFSPGAKDLVRWAEAVARLLADGAARAPLRQLRELDVRAQGSKTFDEADRPGAHETVYGGRVAAHAVGALDEKRALVAGYLTESRENRGVAPLPQCRIAV